MLQIPNYIFLAGFTAFVLYAICTEYSIGYVESLGLATLAGLSVGVFKFQIEKWSKKRLRSRECTLIFSGEEVTVTPSGEDAYQMSDCKWLCAKRSFSRSDLIVRMGMPPNHRVFRLENVDDQTLTSIKQRIVPDMEMNRLRIAIYVILTAIAGLGGVFLSAGFNEGVFYDSVKNVCALLIIAITGGGTLAIISFLPRRTAFEHWAVVIMAFLVIVFVIAAGVMIPWSNTAPFLYFFLLLLLTYAVRTFVNFYCRRKVSSDFLSIEPVGSILKIVAIEIWP